MVVVIVVVTVVVVVVVVVTAIVYWGHWTLLRMTLFTLPKASVQSALPCRLHGWAHWSFVILNYFSNSTQMAVTGVGIQSTVSPGAHIFCSMPCCISLKNSTCLGSVIADHLVLQSPHPHHEIRMIMFSLTIAKIFLKRKCDSVNESTR